MPQRITQNTPKANPPKAPKAEVYYLERKVDILDTKDLQTQIKVIEQEIKQDRNQTRTWAKVALTIAALIVATGTILGAIFLGAGAGYVAIGAILLSTPLIALGCAWLSDTNDIRRYCVFDLKKVCGSEEIKNLAKKELPTTQLTIAQLRSFLEILDNKKRYAEQKSDLEKLQQELAKPPQGNLIKKVEDLPNPTLETDKTKRNKILLIQYSLSRLKDFATHYLKAKEFAFTLDQLLLMEEFCDKHLRLRADLKAPDKREESNQKNLDKLCKELSSPKPLV